MLEHMNGIDDMAIHFSAQGLLLLNIVLAFIMLGISLELRKEDFTNLLRNKKTTIVGLTAHFLLLPALTFALVKLLHPPPSVALGMILVGSCPGGNMSNLFTHFAKGNTALAVGLTSVSHFLAIVLTPLNFSFYGGLDASTATLFKEIQLPLGDVFQTVILVVVIPLTTGLTINHYKPDAARRAQKIMKPFSLIAFGVFLVVAFAGNAKAFANNLGLILPLVIIHNALALSSGYLFSRVARLDFRDCKTITFETGVQNNGLGLILIFTFFNGMGGMALVAACWGIWHLVTGGLLAFIWSKKIG